MFFILGLLSIEKLIQFDYCMGHLNKALIDQKHVYVYCLFETGWMRGFFLIIVQSKVFLHKVRILYTDFTDQQKSLIGQVPYIRTVLEAVFY